MSGRLSLRGWGIDVIEHRGRHGYDRLREVTGQWENRRLQI